MSILRLLCVMGLLLSSTLWASVGKVALLKGEAVAERNAQTITLQNGSLLEEKDAIKTAKEAQIQLLFEDKTVITLGSESEFKIEEYLNDAQNPKAKFKFNQGTFKTITGNIGKLAPSNFTMETKTSTIGIRGTIVKGNIGEDGDVIACLRGRIVVISRDTGKMVEIPAGQFTTVKPNEAPAAPKETQPGTTDESLAKNTIDASVPAVVSTVEEVKNNTQVTQTNPSLSGTLVIYGLATSRDVDLELAFTLDKATAKSTGTLGAYSLNSPANGVTFRDSGSEAYEGFSYTWSFVGNFDPTSGQGEENEYGEISATNFAGYEQFTSTQGGITSSGEAFWREGFINSGGTPSGYFGSYSDYVGMANSEYVTWGIWSTSNYDYYDYATWLTDQQYWVGGPVITPEETIQNLMTQQASYTYNGQVLGKIVSSGYNSYSSSIDPSSSAVMLKFNFNTASTLDESSYIRFSALGSTWDLKPATSSVTASGFNATLQAGTMSSVSIDSASLNGKFFGTDAQAVGGTFKAISSTQQAIGVFKAVR